MNAYKRIITLMLIVVIVFALVGCNMTPVEKKEQPHLYWKTIDVVVESVDKKHWFATTHRYEMSITVYSEEYNLRKTLQYSSSGMITPNYWTVEKGAIISAELYSWVMDSTGEIIRRDINQLK